ncbi:helix-turn-helix transcriptional regulator [Nocardioides sp. NBC_00850]|uniref:helix-turn-helix transcriptional regulator n=1 Tax=Nocardioides sp. NBC_00850 TaxID=2976001 RepID=UPI00386A1298|nr:helix-turn-helix transcriptional regulator [Nocardioides sp. NBC_00850]
MTTELGEFLRSRRAAISPEDAGLVSYGARRVPGLRREELAMLAGVSPTYYTRLEQADHHNASDSVIDALARALRLSAEEHDHLRRLARPVETVSASGRNEEPRPNAVAMLMDFPGPAVIIDHANYVLAWNDLGHHLYGHGLDFDAPYVGRSKRPNLIRRFFLEPGGPELFVDRESTALQMVGFLRYSSGLHPDDQLLSCLVGELVQRSDLFAELWAEHPVMDCGYGIKRLRHPAAGRMDLAYEAMVLPDTSQRIVLYRAEPGSPSADALEGLTRGQRSLA